jgi:hypothetical protein
VFLSTNDIDTRHLMCMIYTCTFQIRINAFTVFIQQAANESNPMKVAVPFLVSTLLLLLLQGPCQADLQDAAEAPEARTAIPSSLRRDRSDRELSTGSERVLVQYLNEQGREKALARSSRLYHDFHRKNVLAIEIDKQNLMALSNNPNIVSIEDDGVYEAQGFHERTLADNEHEYRTLQQQQQVTPYGISLVQADRLSIGPHPVKVCITDTGVAKKHPDLTKKRLKGADRDSSINGALLYWHVDAVGHGTHVTGTITATNNNFGVRGIGNIPIFMTRALDDSGGARESDVYGAVEQCTHSGAKIISMSIGGSGMSQTFKDLLTSLYDEHGFLLVAAAGNSGANSVSWPAAHPRVIAVSAVNEDRSIWSSSNYGNEVELSAPGNMVLSTTINSVGAFVYRQVRVDALGNYAFGP